MPSQLEELVEFLHHGNTQIRQIACENLVGFSTSQPSLFKRDQLVPIKDLKLLVRDYPTIAKNALTMLVNLSADEEVLRNLAEDDAFAETLLSRVTNPKEPNANEITMLLANLAKSDHTKRIVGLKRAVPSSKVSSSPMAMDQLMDCFVRGDTDKNESPTNYDYLSYFFADISKFEEGRAYFTTPQDYDGVIPITKLAVFTEHHSHIRRKGVASALKNVAFEVSSHPRLLSETEVNLLPYILLPIAGPEELDPDEMSGMLPDLQLLPPDKQRDSDPEIIVTHLETLLLLTTTREARDHMRAVQVYPLIRECESHMQNEEVSEVCNRLVQVIMRREEGEEAAEQEEMEAAREQALTGGGGGGSMQRQIKADDEDNKMVDIF